MIEMGKVYWKINNTTDTFESLKSILQDFGLAVEKQRPLGNEFGFNRVIDWRTKNGISFSTIWHINLCAIQFGDFDTDLAEIHFDSIQGSYIPYAEHDTIDFTYKGNTVCRLALKQEDKQ